MAATLSIVMAVFNRPEELKTMLDSLLANTYQDWELLAVDDGSEQETLSVLEQYAEMDGRIHFIKREKTPKGAQTCRNIGFEHAVGEYIVFFDSDDFFAPYGLEQRVKEMRAHPELDFMIFRSGIFQKGRFLAEPSMKSFGYPIYKDDTAAFCARVLPFVVCNNIYRTKALRGHYISWDERLLSMQDGDFNLQVLLAGLRYGYAQNPPDYGYRITGNEGSVSKRIISTEHLNSHLYLIDKNYRTVQNKYGSKYNKALYLGALFIYNLAFAVEEHDMQAHKLADIVFQYSPWYGRLFRAKIIVHRFLRHIFANGVAKKIALTDYMLWRKWLEQKAASRRNKCMVLQ